MDTRPHCRIIPNELAMRGKTKIDAILLSIHPEHLENIQKNKKTVEIRRRVPLRFLQAEYIGWIRTGTSGTPYINTISRIDRIQIATPSNIWKEHGYDAIRLDHEAFQSYTMMKNIICAYVLIRTIKFRNLILLKDLRHAPRGHQYRQLIIDKRNKSWLDLPATRHHTFLDMYDGTYEY